MTCRFLTLRRCNLATTIAGPEVAVGVTHKGGWTTASTMDLDINLGIEYGLSYTTHILFGDRP